jgi:cytochrome b subunit of formate dehydrogenase
MSQSLVLLKRLSHWLLLIVTVVYLLTGLGITQYRIMEYITFGLLNKNLSFNIHDNLLAPFVALLIFHMIVSMASQRTKQK